MPSPRDLSSRPAWRLWRVTQSNGEQTIVVWMGTDGDEEFARQQFQHIAALAPRNIETTLQFQDPPEDPPWQTVTFNDGARDD